HNSITRQAGQHPDRASLAVIQTSGSACGAEEDAIRRRLDFEGPFHDRLCPEVQQQKSLGLGYRQSVVLARADLGSDQSHAGLERWPQAGGARNSEDMTQTRTLDRHLA